MRLAEARHGPPSGPTEEPSLHAESHPLGHPERSRQLDLVVCITAADPIGPDARTFDVHPRRIDGPGRVLARVRLGDKLRASALLPEAAREVSEQRAADRFAVLASQPQGG